jgi:hypothetical protein
VGSLRRYTRVGLEWKVGVGKDGKVGVSGSRTGDGAGMSLVI